MSESGEAASPNWGDGKNGDAAALDAGLEKRLSAVETKARRKIEDWAKKLVDLSKRNRLLYYRATKRTSLTFQYPRPDAIYSRLVDGGYCTFYRPPELPPLIVGRPRETTPLESELARRRPLERDLVTTQRDPIEIDRSLDAIERKARAEFEDRGTHVLYLAWNLLRWVDPKVGEEHLSPLVLVPLELSRASVTQPYQLRAAGDSDPFINPALRVKLELDFSLNLPDIDLDDTAPSAITAQIRAALPSAWAIEEHAAIGIFGFAKEAMYRDLVDHAEVVAQHPVIKSMVKGQVTAELAKTLNVALPSERDLDENKDPGFSVIDADSSQRRAIEAANRGLSFVLYGPPGTGKSQTITNIIAEFIGRGKSVLFVSQKMAALEVVANRLEEAELRDLVLELHSAKASRGEVARALAQALDSHPKPSDSTVDTTFNALKANRATLNTYVDALHKRREPLGHSAFEVLADLTSLANVPAIEGPAIDATTATADDQSGVVRNAQRLSDAWLPVEEGEGFPWWDVAVPVGGAAERERIKDDLLKAREAVAALEVLDRDIGRACEWPMPDSQEERRAHAQVGQALPGRTPAPVEWLTTDDLTAYEGLLDRWTSRSAEHANLVDALESSYGPRWREMRPQMHRELSGELAALTAHLGGLADWDRLVAAVPETVDAGDKLPGDIAVVAERLADLDRSLGLATVVSRAGAQRAVGVAQISQDRNRPAAAWLSRARLGDAHAFADTHGSKYPEQRQAAAELAERYDEGILGLDLDPLLERMSRWYGHWWNRLRPQHRADRASLVAVTRSRILLPSVLDDLRLACRVRDARADLAVIEAQARDLLGPYARGLETDPEAIKQALAAADQLVALPPGAADWNRLAAVATAEAPYSPEIERQADGVTAALAAVDATLATLTAFTAATVCEGLHDWSLPSTEAWSGELVTLLGGLVGLQADLAASGETSSVSKALEDARLRRDIETVESELTAAEPVLRAALRGHYEGFATDWPALRAAATWAATLRERYGSELPDGVAQDAMTGVLDHLPWEEHARAIDALDRAVTQVAASFSNEGAEAASARLRATASRAKAWLDERLSRIDDLAIWQAYLSARHSLEGGGWGPFVEQAVERRTARADLAPAARRAWLDGWFASLASGHQELGDFTRAEHERVVDLFRQTDSKLVQLGRERVLREYADRKPAPATVQGGEQATVRREAVKRRKHLPVRTLLDSLPTLLPKIKPCLMMSPLSVSHFLTADAKFDLVVFDEASQVPPEDAVNCIYRGRQLIVAGDPKQLPPTDFFQLSALSEQDGEFEEDIDDFESVLDLCRGMGLPPHSLEWHYRSRHDALIAFSNHFIYDGKLVTFPAPYEHSEDLGVSFVHVPDAVFDRGRSASNPIEARRVVDVVVDHWRRHPGHSIGVVAFSVAQQDAVEDEMARRIRQQPGLEQNLGAGRLDAFFVKNLETVQGDERDVIVFTIGYGRDDQGRIFNNFGALNRPGGARRLNVAVTRARRRVVVVSSIRAGDLRIPDVVVQAGSLPPGAALLRAYLDYAERGALPEAAAASRSEGITAIELDVAQVVRDLGYEVVERVGTSRYRVDLAVVSKVQPGRLALGIECDGAMYRDAQTARDRDRLRDFVLRGLGWSVHRVWAPAWYFSRQEELKRLQTAIAAAEQRVAVGDNGEDRRRTTDDESRQPRPRVELEEVKVDGPEDAVQLGWAAYYKPALVMPYNVITDFSDWWMRDKHAERVASLVTAEGPIHDRVIATRLTRAFGLARAGSRIWETVLTAIDTAEHAGAVRRRGAFVWPARGDLGLVRVPSPRQDDTVRVIEHIPPEELELALMRVAETAGTIDPGTIRVAVSRIFGFERTGGKIDGALEVRLAALLQQKRLALSAGAVVLGPKAALPKVVRADSSTDEFPAGTWVRHPRLGVARVIRTSGSLVTIDLNGEERQIETKLVQLVPVPRPK